MASMARVLKPGGSLILNVAALDILSGSHAVLSEEVRRYTRPLMRQALSRAGLTPERIYELQPVPADARHPLVATPAAGGAAEPDVGDHRALGAGQRGADGRALTRGARPAAHQPAGRQLAARARPQASLIGRPLIAVLELVQPLVEAALGQQLLVRAGSRLAAVEDQDAVDVLDRRQPVGDGDGRPAGMRTCRASRISSSRCRRWTWPRRGRGRRDRRPAPARTTAVLLPDRQRRAALPTRVSVPPAAPRRTGRRGRRRRRARCRRASAPAGPGVGQEAAGRDTRPAAPAQQMPRSSARSSSRMSTPSTRMRPRWTS